MKYIDTLFSYPAKTLASNTIIVNYNPGQNSRDRCFQSPFNSPLPSYSMLGCPFYLEKMAKHPYNTQTATKIVLGEEGELK